MLTDTLKKRILADSFLGRKLGLELIKVIDGVFGRSQLLVTGNVTVDADDNGKTLVVTAAANITLPVAGPTVGPYHGFNIANANMAIIAPSSNDSIMLDGDAGADSVTFSTADHKIGSAFSLYALDTDGDGAYKWALLNLGNTAPVIA